VLVVIGQKRLGVPSENTPNTHPSPVNTKLQKDQTSIERRQNMPQSECLIEFEKLCNLTTIAASPSLSCTHHATSGLDDPTATNVSTNRTHSVWR
jgi:hypothetical protein